MNKAIWQSKTFYGALIALAAVIFPGIWANLGVGDDYSALADKVQSVVGALLVVYGRFAAGGVSLTGK